MTTSKQIKKYGWVALKLVLSILGFWYAFRFIDLELFTETIRETKYGYVALAVLLYLLSQLVSSYRLKYILTAVGDNVPSKWNAMLYWQGMAYNLFLPGGIGGDAYKILAYSKRTDKKAKTYVLPLLADRLLGLAAIVILVGVCMPFLRDIEVWWQIDWSILPILFLVVLVYVIVRKWFHTFAKIFWKSIGQSILIQLLQVGAVYCILLAIEVDLFTVAALSIASFVFLISSIATAIPVFLGGLGAREVVFATIFPMFGLASTEGVWIAMLFSIVVIISSVPGLFFGFSKD